MPEKDENINGDLISASTATEADNTQHQSGPRANTAATNTSSLFSEHRLHSSMAENDHLWSSPWANLMMVLFAILFLMISLQAQQTRTDPTAPTTTQNHDEVATIASDTNLNLDATASNSNNESSALDARTLALMPVILAEIKQYIQTLGGDKIKATTLVDHSIRISLSGSVLFESDSTKITDQAQDFLDKLSVTLTKNPQQIHVIGHTDDQAVDLARYPDKWALSLIRASTVTRYLINQGKVEPYKFTIMGRSEYEPVAANLNEAARAMNRRVDIIVSRKTSRTVETGL